MTAKCLAIAKDKCSGCRLCETICALRHFEEVNPLRSRIRVKKIDTKGVDLPIVCHQCRKPRCVSACPNHALRKDDESGLILLDTERCKGIGDCVRACPHGAAWVDPVGQKVLMCDLCGGDPDCVKWCFTGALQVDEDSGGPEANTATEGDEVSNTL